jgi:hypothetical protein
MYRKYAGKSVYIYNYMYTYTFQTLCIELHVARTWLISQYTQCDLSLIHMYTLRILSTFSLIQESF